MRISVRNNKRVRIDSVAPGQTIIFPDNPEVYVRATLGAYCGLDKKVAGNIILVRLSDALIITEPPDRMAIPVKMTDFQGGSLIFDLE